MVIWGGIFLPKTMVDALGVFLAAPRKARKYTDWHARCIAGQKAASFFKATRDSDVFRLTASKIAADAYEDIRDQKEVAVINSSLVLKVREQASSMRTILPAAQHLPGDANTKEFRSGLDSLCQWATPASAPANKSGDICARAFTLTLARKFAIAFSDVPVEYIHSLVAMGWPNRSLSATWKLLCGAVTDRIKREAESIRLQEASAHGAAVFAIRTASTARHVLSEIEHQVVEQLQSEMERVRQGKRRFSNDAARLQAMQEIARSLEDSGLADELLIVIRDRLKEYSHDHQH